MDIRATILQEHSKKQALLIADYIGNNQERFDHLMHLFFTDEYRVVQRAAYAVSHCTDQHIELVYPHLPAMVEYLKDRSVHIAIRRNIVRILAQLEIPEKVMGDVATLCFDFLIDPKEAVAVKIYSMEVLYHLTLKEPDLKNELILVIEENMVYGSAGVRSRGRKVLKRLEA